MKFRTIAALALLTLTTACANAGPTAVDVPEVPPLSSSGGMGSGH